MYSSKTEITQQVISYFLNNVTNQQKLPRTSFLANTQHHTIATIYGQMEDSLLKWSSIFLGLVVAMAWLSIESYWAVLFTAGIPFLYAFKKWHTARKLMRYFEWSRPNLESRIESLFWELYAQHKTHSLAKMDAAHRTQELTTWMHSLSLLDNDTYGKLLDYATGFPDAVLPLNAAQCRDAELALEKKEQTVMFVRD